MKPITKFIDIFSKQLAYYDIGDQDAPVLLLGHSYLWNKDMWREQFDLLSKDYRLIVPDLWAHGESAGLPCTPTSIKMMSEEYFHFMQLLGVEEFSIIGLSVGGMWGAQMALDYREHIKALILMGTFVGSEPEQTQEAYLGLLEMFKLSQGFHGELVEATWPYFFSEKLPKDSPLIDEMKQYLTSIPTQNVEDIYEIGKAIFTRESNLDKLKQLQMPFAIITGEDDISRVPSESEEMANAADTQNLYYIKDAGHISCLEQPKLVNEKLQSFLAENLIVNQ